MRGEEGNGVGEDAAPDDCGELLHQSVSGTSGPVSVDLCDRTIQIPA